MEKKDVGKSVSVLQMCFIWASLPLATEAFERHGILEQLDH